MSPAIECSPGASSQQSRGHDGRSPTVATQHGPTIFGRSLSAQPSWRRGWVSPALAAAVTESQGCINRRGPGATLLLRAFALSTPTTLRAPGTPMAPRSHSAAAELITLKQLAEIVGEEPSTIDYWTKMGLLVCKRRGNARVYDLDLTQQRCRQIRQRKDDGLNLAAIKREFDGRG